MPPRRSSAIASRAASPDAVGTGASVRGTDSFGSAIGVHRPSTGPHNRGPLRLVANDCHHAARRHPDAWIFGPCTGPRRSDGVADTPRRAGAQPARRPVSTKDACGEEAVSQYPAKPGAAAPLIQSWIWTPTSGAERPNFAELYGAMPTKSLMSFRTRTSWPWLRNLRRRWLLQ
jgi:hypothetical protein